MRYFKFFLLLFLIGCSNYFHYAPDYEKNDISTEKLLNSKAVIITKLTDTQKSYGLGDFLLGQEVSLTFCKVDGSKEAIDFIDTSRDDMRFDIKLVEPGYYKVLCVIKGKGRLTQTWSKFNIGININKSDVLYIGDIIFDSKTGTVELEDNFDKVQQVIKTRAPEFLGKLKKNITWIASSRTTKLLEELNRIIKQ